MLCVAATSMFPEAAVAGAMSGASEWEVLPMMVTMVAMPTVAAALAIFVAQWQGKLLLWKSRSTAPPEPTQQPTDPTRGPAVSAEQLPAVGSKGAGGGKEAGGDQVVSSRGPRGGLKGQKVAERLASLSAELQQSATLSGAALQLKEGGWATLDEAMAAILLSEKCRTAGSKQKRKVTQAVRKAVGGPAEFHGTKGGRAGIDKLDSWQQVGGGSEIPERSGELAKPSAHSPPFRSSQGSCRPLSQWEAATRVWAEACSLGRGTAGTCTLHTYGKPSKSSLQQPVAKLWEASGVPSSQAELTVCDVDWSNRTSVAGGASGTCTVLDLQSGALLSHGTKGDAITALEMLQGGPQWLAGTRQGVVQLWDARARGGVCCQVRGVCGTEVAEVTSQGHQVRLEGGDKQWVGVDLRRLQGLLPWVEFDSCTGLVGVEDPPRSWLPCKGDEWEDLDWELTVQGERFKEEVMSSSVRSAPVGSGIVSCCLSAVRIVTTMAVAL